MATRKSRAKHPVENDAELDNELENDNELEGAEDDEGDEDEVEGKRSRAKINWPEKWAAVFADFKVNDDIDHALAVAGWATNYQVREPRAGSGDGSPQTWRERLAKVAAKAQAKLDAGEDPQIAEVLARQHKLIARARGQLQEMLAEHRVLQADYHRLNIALPAI